MSRPGPARRFPRPPAPGRGVALAALLVPLLLCAGAVLALAALGRGPEEAVVLREVAARPLPGFGPLLVALFLLLILLPFVPGLVEVYWSRDVYPLPVDTGYVRDPRYLGRSLRRIMRRALDGRETVDGEHRVRMSREETVTVFQRCELADGADTDLVFYVRGDLRAGRRVTCRRDGWVRGDASIGAGSRLRALACDGNVELGEGTVVTRWVDAEGDLRAGRDCSLGVLAAAGGALRLDDGCRFRRLAGYPVVTGNGEPAAAPPPPPPLERPVIEAEEIVTVEDMTHWTRGDRTVAAGETLRRPLVVKGELTCAPGAVLPFAAAADGRLVLGAGAVAHGDLFCEGPVEVGEGAVVLGNVFSQDTVRLAAGARVGTAGAPKSVIGKKGVLLGDGVTVHGYVQTDGAGEVRCDASA